ncbi:MAG TPA: hypothetical protein VKT77_11445 [Chthonomonadaceae bacterium]|nr:hypothetical protein [Chthonomonadaceae bacterium]
MKLLAALSALLCLGSIIALPPPADAQHAYLVVTSGRRHYRHHRWHRYHRVYYRRTYYRHAYYRHRPSAFLRVRL